MEGPLSKEPAMKKAAQSLYTGVGTNKYWIMDIMEFKTIKIGKNNNKLTDSIIKI